MKNAILALAILASFPAAAQTQEFSSYTYGNRTVVEFKQPPRSLSFKDENGTEMLYERISESIYRLPKLVRFFTITVNGKTSDIGEKPSSPVALPLPAVKQEPSIQSTSSVQSMTTPALVQIPMMTEKGVVMVYAPASSVNAAISQPAASSQVPAQSSLTSGEKIIPSQPKTWAVKQEHSTIEDVINDWAKQAGYEVFYETQQLPISIKSDRQIPADSFLDALTILGESYRNSAAPFQVTPTKFKQVIIRPMANGNIENQ